MNEQSFEALRRLADFFDASVGASRPVVDCGWAGPSEQIGQTGSFVHPKVYLAFGISGAIQHLTGMKNSQCIIAVNTNLNSPIFQYCDYGIRGDAIEYLLFGFYPVLKRLIDSGGLITKG